MTGIAVAQGFELGVKFARDEATALGASGSRQAAKLGSTTLTAGVLISTTVEWSAAASLGRHLRLYVFLDASTAR